jgi:PST family polysaccharide transporter/lipopolysaccharide exporter
LTSAIVPAASELNAQQDRAKLLKLYKLGSKYLIFMSTPIACFVVIYAKEIIGVWVGEGFTQSVVVLQILAVGYFFNLVSGTASTIAQGMGRPDLERKYGIAMAILNLCLSLYFIIQIGLYGAALGSALALGLCSLYFMFLFHNLIQEHLRSFLSLFVWPVSLSAASGVLTWMLFHAVFPELPGQDRMLHALFLAGQMVVYMAAYLVMIWKSHYFKGDEITQLLHKIPWMQGITRRWRHEKQHSQV